MILHLVPFQKVNNNINRTKNTVIIAFALFVLLLLLHPVCAETNCSLANTKYNIEEEENMYVVERNGTAIHSPIPYRIYTDNVEIHYYNGNQYIINRFFYSEPGGVTRVALAIDPGNVFTDFIYGEVFPYSEGLAVACYAGINAPYERAGYGYIGLDGKETLPFQWIWCESFTDGKALVTYETADSYEYLVINRDGIVVEIPLR